MRLKRIFAMIVSLILLITCCGCALAEEEEAAQNADGENVIVIDGDIMLQVRFDFREIDADSSFGMEICLDDILVAEVSQSELYTGTLMVSEGEHTMTFFRTDRDEVQDEYTFEIKEPMILRCKFVMNDGRVDMSDF